MKTNALVLIDFDKVDTLLEGFNKSTGFVTAILDLDGNVLSKSGWRQMCTEFHRTNPETSKKCTISDTELAQRMAEGEKYHFYKCLNGLIDVAVPVIIDGEHVASLFSGQFFFEEPDISFFKNQAKKYGFEENKYLDALSKVPIVSQEKVKTAMDFLLNMTQMISDMAFQKLEQMELNKTIKKNEEKFKAVFESASVGKSITLPTGEINVNQAFCDMLGYTREELQSRKWQDITPQDEVIAVQKKLNPMLKGEKDSARFEKRYICKDGSYKWADVSVSLLRDDKGKPLHFITTVIDITERKLAEQALSESEEMMRNSQSLAHICSYSTNLKVDDIAKSAWACSLEFYEIFGIDKTYPHTIEGWAAFIHPDYREEIVAYHEYVIKEKIRFEHEYKIIRINDGAERWVYGTGELEFDEKRNPIRMHGAIQDITERKQVELQIIEAKEKAEESDRLKTAFLHNISHEIRTPMNAIIGFSALLSEPELSAESKTYYTDTITQSSNQLLSIINDIVDISNIEAGIVNISKEEVRINRSLDKLEDQFRLKAKEKGLVLRKVTPLPDEEAIILADDTKLMQVISNLLSNAFKFTNEGTIEFGYKPGKEFIEFYVSDTGIGIPNDQLTRIFDRFYQVDFKMARLNEGTGLGLAISKSFIDLMGGEIWVESEPGKGSTFFFTVPFSRLQKREETVLPEKRQYSFDREYNILVAEDDTQNSHLIGIFLAIQNIIVTIVNNGAEAVEHCRTGKPVDLVLMDLKMPVMDGFEATRLIKEFLPDLPVIAQTAYASEDDKKRALSSGCNDFITKPFKRETLISKIRDNFTPPLPDGLSAP